MLLKLLKLKVMRLKLVLHQEILVVLKFWILKVGLGGKVPPEKIPGMAVGC